MPRSQRYYHLPSAGDLPGTLLRSSEEAQAAFRQAREDAVRVADLAFAVDSAPVISVTSLTTSTIEAEHRKTSDRFRPGDMLIATAPDLRYLCHIHHVTDYSFILPVALWTVHLTQQFG